MRQQSKFVSPARAQLDATRSAEPNWFRPERTFKIHTEHFVIAACGRRDQSSDPQLDCAASSDVEGNILSLFENQSSVVVELSNPAFRAHWLGCERVCQSMPITRERVRARSRCTHAASCARSL